MKDKFMDTKERCQLLSEEVDLEIYPAVSLEGPPYLCRFMLGRPLPWKKCVKETFVWLIKVQCGTLNSQKRE